jgi:hypothetical protein
MADASATVKFFRAILGTLAMKKGQQTVIEKTAQDSNKKNVEFFD